MPTEVEIDCGFDSLDQQVADAVAKLCERLRNGSSNLFAGTERGVTAPLRSEVE
jgi:hypothetical protein